MTIMYLAAVAMLPLHSGTDLLSTLLPALPADVIKYERMVEILKVQPVRSKENPKSHSLEVTFNLIPDLPKGVEIEFELQRGDGTGKVGETVNFRLENDNRKNIKWTFKPSQRLTKDRYTFMIRIPPDRQTPEVRKALEAKPNRFPPDQPGWPFAYPDQTFEVGTAEDEAAEAAEVKEFFEARLDKIVTLNGEGVDELEKFKSGEIKEEALKKFLTGWMGRMAGIQRDVNGFVDKEPGLYAKHTQLCLEVQRLGRMVAKRIARSELPESLKKGAGRLPTVEGFDANFAYRVAGPTIQAQVKKIEAILDPEAAKEEAGAKDGSDADAKDAEGSEKAAEKDAGKKDEAEKDKDKSETPAPEGKKADPKKNPKDAKTSGKSDKKKS